MRLYLAGLVVALLAHLVPAIPLWHAEDEVDIMAKEALQNQIAYQQSRGAWNKTCTVQNAVVRRECHSERKNYTDAVLCLMTKPAQLSAPDAPGIRNRYDDFVSVHIRQTPRIHQTANFLSWHRYYIWTWEKTLREECGYDGYLPYWAWEKWADDPKKSPMFDGSEYSLSGDGEYVPHKYTEVRPGIMTPPAQGGGCVTSGPFKNMTVHLGPVDPSFKAPGVKAQSGNGLDYNPRCLRRDISSYVSRRWTSLSEVVGLIKNYTHIGPFQNTMQGDPASDYLGVHGGGHFVFNGDPGGDLYTSPGDPAFFLHHGMIDRVFWIWQNRDPENRRHVVAGTHTMYNKPPSQNGTLDDAINLGGLEKIDYRIDDLLDTLDGPFCYIYQ